MSAKLGHKILFIMDYKPVFGYHYYSLFGIRLL